MSDRKMYIAVPVVGLALTGLVFLALSTRRSDSGDNSKSANHKDQQRPLALKNGKQDSTKSQDTNSAVSPKSTSNAHRLECHVKDTAGNPVAGASVRLALASPHDGVDYSKIRFPIRLTSTAEGEAAFPDLPPGTYQVTADHADFLESASDQLKIADASVRCALTLIRPAAATISVTDVQAQRYVVVVTRDNNLVEHELEITNGDTIQRLRPGMKRILIIPTYAGFKPRAVGCELHENQTTSIAVDVEAGDTVTGRVVDAQDLPLAGICVEYEFTISSFSGLKKSKDFKHHQSEHAGGVYEIRYRSDGMLLRMAVMTNSEGKFATYSVTDFVKLRFKIGDRTIYTTETHPGLESGSKYVIDLSKNESNDK